MHEDNVPAAIAQVCFSKHVTPTPIKLSFFVPRCTGWLWQSIRPSSSWTFCCVLLSQQWCRKGLFIVCVLSFCLVWGYYFLQCVLFWILSNLFFTAFTFLIYTILNDDVYAVCELQINLAKVAITMANDKYIFTVIFVILFNIYSTLTTVQCCEPMLKSPPALIKSKMHNNLGLKQEIVPCYCLTFITCLL